MSSLDSRFSNPIDRLVGQQLSAARELRKISQEEFAELLESPLSQIQNYETGKDRIPASRLHVMASILNVPIEFFYKGINAEDSDDGEVQLLRLVLAVPPEYRHLLVELAQSLIAHNKILK